MGGAVQPRRSTTRGSRAAAALGAVALAVLVSAAIAACGTASSTASGPSSLDPAGAAPRGAPLFFELAVRPQGSLRSGELAAVRAVGGQTAVRRLERSLAKLTTAKNGVCYRKGVAPWLGQRVGVVLTGVAQDETPDVALIAPTNDPSAARSCIAARLSKGHDDGISHGTVIGHYAIVGGSDAYPQVLAAAKDGDGLASLPAYQRDTARLGSGLAASAWISGRAVDKLLVRAVASKDPAARAELARVSSKSSKEELALGLTATAHTIVLRMITSGVPGGAAASAASVAALPAASWLALATAKAPASLGNSLATSAGDAAVLPGVAGKLAALGPAVAGALGPLRLAVTGDSPLDIGVGLTTKPAKASGARKLFTTIANLLGEPASGSTTSFSLPLPTGKSVTVSDAGGRFTLLYGLSSVSALLHPSAALSGNATYRTAAAQLPSGDSIPFYLDFAPIAGLVALADHSPNAGRVEQTLGRFSYLITGNSGDETEVVLGLR